MSSLLKYLEEFFSWLLDLLLWIPMKLWELISDGLALVIEAIPVPAWLDVSDPFASIDPGIVYFADGFMLTEGIGIVLSAYLVRFLIRRIPIVG